MKTFLTTCFLALQTAVLFAQDAGGEMAPPRDQGLWQTLTMVGVAMLFFYLILWRPEQKRRKTMEDQRSALKKGDRVIAMGIVGTISRVQDQTIIVRMVDGTKIEMVKGAVSEILGTEEVAKSELESK